MEKHGVMSKGCILSDVGASERFSRILHDKFAAVRVRKFHCNSVEI